MKMLTLLGIFIFGVSAHAINGRTTYQAKIIKPDGYPLEASSVNFRFTILDPAASCVLYVEDYAAVNMSGTSGLISFALGAGTRTYPVSSTTFASVFDNSTVSFPCQSPGIYNPTPTDARKIVMQFQDSSGWQTLPAMAINAVPFAMYAGKSENSIQLNGKADTAFVENATLAALNCNPATHAITFNGVSFSCIPVGSGSGGITSVTTSGTVLTTGGTASAPVISITAATMSQDGYLTSLDYAEFKAKLSASSTQIINTLGYAPVSSSAVATQINNSNLSGDVSGTVSANSVISVGGKSANQISTSVDDTLAATASSTADTIVKRNSSGNFTANDIYANAAKINYVDIYKPSTSFNIRLQAPTSLSTNYVLNLPTASGTTGQVLSTDGAGNLSWINPSTGSVVSVSATAPLASTGGATPTISITQATSSTDGYLSSTDFNTFNNKQAATSAAIIATLGYTPADNAASGTYAQKANNLSDLASVATARTNLGLGTFATASSIDLGSASATGIIAEARLQTQSNVTSGTQYTKVTVDGKGHVTSGAQLSSSDVTTALGYTPSNAASAGITTLNGSSSATQTFAIGTSGNSPAFNTVAGTHTLNIPLANTGSVIAGLLSNTDYTTFNNKQTATSAAIIATLGYTPADNAASGTYLVKASNLSDLVNVATARTNLGLGTFATASSIDLGSVSATGTLAIARLPSFGGDATIAAASNTIVFSNSGVTAGTYTKLTVDAKGRVTSSSALASSDVTTALGYTPANSASGVTSLNGSVSQTQTFATTNTGTGFGITTANGVHTFAIPLAASSSVVGGLLSNTDYTTFNNKQNATSAAIIATLGYTPAHATSATQWTTNGSNIYYSTGNIGVGILNPTAKLELASGTASVAPLKFTSGTLLGSAQSGTMEYDGFNFYLTDSTNTRRTIATGSSAGSIDNASIINSTGNISMVPVGSVIVSSTTASTNSNTGALVVKGGLGVAGNINTAGSLNVSGSSVIDGSLKLSTMTSGSMLFAGANGVVTQDNSSLFWDGANKRLGIGSNSPAQTLSVSGTSYFSGNVGVGTSTPTVRFDARISTTQSVSGSVADSYPIANFINNGSDGGQRGIQLGAPTGNLISPAYLKVTGTSNRFSIINQFDTENLTVLDSGNVGVGTTAPSYLLDVQKSSGGSLAHFTASGDDRGAYIFGYDAGGYFSGNSSYDGSNWIAKSTTPSYIAMDPSGMEFFSNSGATIGASYTPASRLKILNNGNVGIGTTAPNASLQVSGTGIIIDSGANASYGSGIKFMNTTYKHYTAGVKGSNFVIADTSVTGTQTWTPSPVERLVIDSTGNVGIGTSSPTNTLDVVGLGLTITRDQTFGTLASFRKAYTATSNEDPYMQFLHQTASGGTFNRYGYIQSGQSHNGMTIQAENGAGAGSNLMLNKLGGSVGVGTSTAASMTAQFNIVGSSAGEVAQYIHNTNPAGYAVLRMNSNWGGYASGTALHTFGPGFGVAGEAYAPSTTTLTGFDSGGLNLHANAGAMRFFTGGYSNVNNQMILTSSGNLGIGVSAPVEKLEVAGNLKVTGDIITSVDSGWALGGAPTLKLTGRSGASLTNATTMYRTATPLALHRDFRASFSYRTSNSTHFGLTFHSQLTDPHDNNYAVIMRSTNIVRVQKRAAAVQTLPIGEIATGLSLTDGNWHTVDVEVVGQNIVVDIDGTNFVNSSLADGTFTNGRVGFINYDGTVEFNNLVVQEISDKTLAKGLIVPEGNVGIGTNVPTVKAHIYDQVDGPFNGLVIDNRKIYGAGTGINETSRMLFSLTEPSIPDPLNRVMSYIESGVESENSSTESFQAFATRASGVVAEKMRINSAGYVGIGTTAPDAPLVVSGTGSSGAGLLILRDQTSPTGSTNRGPHMFFDNADGEKGWIGYYDSATHGSGVQMNLRSYTGPINMSAASTGNHLFIATSGNVGVGTTSPASDAPWSSPALDISGSRGVAILRTTAVNGLSTLRFVGPTAGSDLHVNFDDSNGALKFMPQSGSILGLVQEKTGNVGIGTTAPSEKLHVVGNLRVQGSTDCTLGNGAGGTNCSSDMRLKENIKPIPYALEKIVSLKGVEFDWNAKSISHGRHDIGVIAQDVEKVFPSAVIDDKNTGYKKVDYAVLVAPLIQAIKELYKLVMNRFEVQDRQIASITEKAAKLEAENVALKKYLCSKDPAAPICK